MYKIYNSLRYGEVKLLLLVHELGAEQAEAETGHCEESGEDGDLDEEGTQIRISLPLRLI